MDLWVKGIHLKLVTYFVIDMKTFDGQKNTLMMMMIVDWINVSCGNLSIERH